MREWTAFEKERMAHAAGLARTHGVELGNSPRVEDVTETLGIGAYDLALDCPRILRCQGLTTKELVAGLLEDLDEDPPEASK